MNKSTTGTGLALLFLMTLMHPQMLLGQEKKTDYLPEIHGTILAKNEYQPEMEAGRLEVRNGRFSLTGKVAPTVAYKAEMTSAMRGASRCSTLTLVLRR